MKYEIGYIGDPAISDVHHININIDENNYNVIFGKYINGGFFSIPNKNCGGELSRFDDVFWNTCLLYTSKQSWNWEPRKSIKSGVMQSLGL